MGAITQVTGKATKSEIGENFGGERAQEGVGGHARPAPIATPHSSLHRFIYFVFHFYTLAFPMSSSSKVSRSQIFLCIALLTILGALFIGAVVSEHAPRYAKLKEQGLAAEGTVTRKDTIVKQEKSRKGRTREVTEHFVTVNYDGMSKTPYATAAAGKPYVASPYATMIHGDILVSSSEFEEIAEGAKLSVTYLPSESFKPLLTSTVMKYTPVWQMLTAILLLLVGVAACVLSWKTRVPRIRTA